MGKGIEWLRNKLVYLHELDMWNWKQCEPNSKEQSHFYGCLAAYERVLDFLDELDEPETLSINKEQLIKRIENYIPLHNKTVGDVVDGILEIVKQLPEMEILSQEWIREHAKAVAYDGMPDQTEIVYVDDLQSLLVPKQELPVVPRFVAEWIKEMKQDERPLYSAMSSLMNKTNHEWAIWKTTNKNFSEIVAQAWLDGFTIANEPLYRARLKVITDKYIASYLRTRFSDNENRLKELEIGNKYIHEDYRHLSEFTEHELKTLNIWDSDQWEIEEVSE